jgi:hypothetical protein
VPDPGLLLRDAVDVSAAEQNLLGLDTDDAAFGSRLRLASQLVKLTRCSD